MFGWGNCTNEAKIQLYLNFTLLYDISPHKSQVKKERKGLPPSTQSPPQKKRSLKPEKKETKSSCLPSSLQSFFRQEEDVAAPLCGGVLSGSYHTLRAAHAEPQLVRGSRRKSAEADDRIYSHKWSRVKGLGISASYQKVDEGI